MLAHDDVGSGPPIVFVHGFPLDRRMWRRAMAEAARIGWRALAVDLRGFGESRSLPLAPSIDAYADDLAAFLEHKQLKSAVICGLSMGGYVALALHRGHRERVQGLVLADTKAGPDGEEAKKGRALNIERAENEGVAAIFDAMAPKAFSANARAHVIAELRAIAESQDPEAAIAALEAMRDRPDATPELETIRARTRVVVGTEDQITPPAESENMTLAIASATFYRVEGAGHFSNAEQPEGFLDAVFGRDYLAHRSVLVHKSIVDGAELPRFAVRSAIASEDSTGWVLSAFEPADTIDPEDYHAMDAYRALARFAPFRLIAARGRGTFRLDNDRYRPIAD
jgi:3-oxoadipate enol-lactonase